MAIEGMDKLQRRFAAISAGQGNRKLMGELGLLAVAEAKRIVPRKTGNLGRTIRLGQVSDTNASILAGGQLGVGYAAAVELGARAHKIRPRRAKILRWARNAGDRRLSGSARTGTSDFVYAREVDHPGNAPRPYLRPGAAEALAKAGLAERVVKAWNEAA